MKKKTNADRNDSYYHIPDCAILLCESVIGITHILRGVTPYHGTYVSSLAYVDYYF